METPHQWAKKRMAMTLPEKSDKGFAANPEERKRIARAVRKFMGCANRLVDAHKRIAKHSAGSQRAVSAWEHHDRMDEAYDASYAELDQIIDALDGMGVDA